MVSATRRLRSALGLVSLLAVFPAQGRAAECLQQKPLPDGCLQTGGALGCTAATQTTGPSRLDISPDGETVYLATFSTSTAVVLDRDTATGILTPVAGVSGCLSDSGSGGACTDVRNFSFPSNVEVSTDLSTAYFATSNGIAIFDRNVSTGALAQKAGTAGCINETGAEGCAVATGVALSGELALSPDNRNVYVGGNGITVFDRNTLTGELTQKAGAAGCVTDDGSGGACTDGSALLGVSLPVVSPDGKNVYAVSFTSSAIAVFDRDTGTGALTQKAGTGGCISDDGSGGACADGFQLVNPSSAAISPDGRNLYVVAGFTGSSNAITVFDRDPLTGALAQKAGLAGCVSETGSGGLCTDGRGLVSPRAVSVSSDGQAVYVSMEDSDGVAVFQRDSLTGELTQPAGAAGCINRLGGDGCAVGVAMNDSLGMVSSADGLSVYVGGYGTNSVAVLDRVTCPLPPTTTTTSTTTTSTTSTSTTTSTDTTTTTVPAAVVCGPVPIATSGCGTSGGPRREWSSSCGGRASRPTSRPSAILSEPRRSTRCASTLPGRRCSTCPFRPAEPATAAPAGARAPGAATSTGIPTARPTGCAGSNSRPGRRA